MKYVILLLLLFPFPSFAQDNPFYMSPPAGKARIFVLYDPYERWQRNIFIGTTPVFVSKAPLFINGLVKCRLTFRTYTYFDIEPGTYKVAAQESGKKLGKKRPVLELYAEEGTIYYLDMEIPDPRFNTIVYLRKIHVMEFQQLVIRRGSRFTENCENTKPIEEGAYLNKRFFIRIPLGLSMPSGSYKNWWPQLSQAFVNRYQPFQAGFEMGVKVGDKNHFLSWGYANSKQPANLTSPNAEIIEDVEVNVNTLYYSYGLSLNAGNRYLLYPKAGISSLNYIFETRTEFVRESEGVNGFGTSFGLHFEYRISRTFSVDASWDYLNGTVVFRSEKKKLNQHRLFAGVRVQF